MRLPRSKRYVPFGLVAAGCLLLVFFASDGFFGRNADGSRNDRLLSYVAAADGKIYVLDLDSGSVIATSDVIEGLGKPTAIDIAPDSSLLYIASERGYRQNDYYPLVAVDLNSNFRVIKRFRIDPSSGPTLDPTVLNTNVRAVYRVVVSNDGTKLYLVYAAPGYEPTTVVDSDTGLILGQTSAVIDRSTVFSPDGTQVANIWPSGSRVSDANGEQTIRQWPGGVAVTDLFTGAVESQRELVANRGLQPPWQEISEPFVYLRTPEQVLEVYDRETGQLGVSLNLPEVAGLVPAQSDPVLLEAADAVALSMTDGEQQGFVVVIDLASRNVRSAIRVGPSPTNVVLGRD